MLKNLKVGLKITMGFIIVLTQIASSSEELSSMAQQLQGLAAQLKIDESEMTQAQNAGALTEPHNLKNSIAASKLPPI